MAKSKIIIKTNKITKIKKIKTMYKEYYLKKIFLIAK